MDCSGVSYTFIRSRSICTISRVCVLTFPCVGHSYGTCVYFLLEDVFSVFLLYSIYCKWMHLVGSPIGNLQCFLFYLPNAKETSLLVLPTIVRWFYCQLVLLLFTLSNVKTITVSSSCYRVTKKPSHLQNSLFLLLSLSSTRFDKKVPRCIFFNTFWQHCSDKISRGVIVDCLLPSVKISTL